jgi:hypothetical protein
MEAELKQVKHQSVYEELESVQGQIAAMKKKEAQIKADILDMHQEQMQKDFGSVTVKDAGFKVVITTPKKVVWNQEGLASVYKSIQASGQNAAEYIEVKYSVPENKFKAWPESIRNEFIGARTVAPGTPAIKIERIEDDA